VEILFYEHPQWQIAKQRLPVQYFGSGSELLGSTYLCTILKLMSSISARLRLLILMFPHQVTWVEGVDPPAGRSSWNCGAAAAERNSHASYTDVSPSDTFIGAETLQQLIVLPATRRRRRRAANPFSAGPPSAVILIRLTPSSPRRYISYCDVTVRGMKHHALVSAV